MTAVEDDDVELEHLVEVVQEAGHLVAFHAVDELVVREAHVLEDVLEVVVVTGDHRHVQLERIEAVGLLKHNFFAVIHLDLVGLEDGVSVLDVDRVGRASGHRVEQEVPVPVRVRDAGVVELARVIDEVGVDHGVGQPVAARRITDSAQDCARRETLDDLRILEEGVLGATVESGSDEAECEGVTHGVLHCVRAG